MLDPCAPPLFSSLTYSSCVFAAASIMLPPCSSTADAHQQHCLHALWRNDAGVVQLDTAALIQATASATGKEVGELLKQQTGELTCFVIKR